MTSVVRSMYGGNVTRGKNDRNVVFIYLKPIMYYNNPAIVVTLPTSSTIDFITLSVSAKHVFLHLS